MRPETAGLVEKMRGCTTHAERHEVMRNRYYGKTAYFVACGPSVTTVLTPRMKSFLRKELTVACKSAYDVIGGYADYHLVNAIRSPRTGLTDWRTIRIGCVDWKGAQADKEFFLNGIDVFYPIDMSHRLIDTLDFEGASFQNTFQRPWGPGILLDVGLFLAEHWGCTRIVVIGWDMGVDKYTHFYSNVDYMERERIREECELMVKAVPSMLAWFKSKGMDIYLCSPRSILPIEQISVEDVLCLKHEL